MKTKLSHWQFNLIALLYCFIFYVFYCIRYFIVFTIVYNLFFFALSSYIFCIICVARTLLSMATSGIFYHTRPVSMPVYLVNPPFLFELNILFYRVLSSKRVQLGRSIVSHTDYNMAYCYRYLHNSNLSY